MIGRTVRRQPVMHATVILVALLVVLPAAAGAQSMYRYRDADGHWVYTDRKPDASVATEELDVAPGRPQSLRIDVEQVTTAAGAVLRAINECVCTVEFGLKITQSQNVAVPGNGSFAITVPPDSVMDIVELAARGSGRPQLGYDWAYVIGDPAAEHRPERPYRVPFAVAASFPVTQAYPSTYTHGDPGSRYAIDFGMPEGTAIYAARGGTVVDVAHGNFKSGVDREYADKANFVRILHADGTIAMYAHLRWDSIRVRRGQRVRRGEYIATSGNTGFSSGPHLHFAVTRNAGLRSESVPVEFEGPGGRVAVMREGQALTAY
jgi:murein DD-endopeptidase MepM/ murein hydrolase activator NlpD